MPLSDVKRCGALGALPVSVAILSTKKLFPLQSRASLGASELSPDLAVHCS
jgi:hypothetical protein